MNRKRGIDKVVRGRRKPVLERPVWAVEATEVNSHRHREEFFCEEAARKHAAWWHRHPGIMDVTLIPPPAENNGELVKRYIPTKEDRSVSDFLAAALEDGKVCPVVKHDIGLWLDSKAWAHEHASA